MNACPLCGQGDTAPLARVRGRDYRECPDCALCFMPAAHHVDAATERAVYDTHHNHDAPGYRAFLARLVDPLCARLAPGAEGLDIGCGPGPVLAAMMAERGVPMRTYDPIYAPDPAPLRRSWDVLTCTEVVEHFRDPAASFAQLAGLLRPGGWLGVMTQWRRRERDFAAWRYLHDPTHVCFYAPDTLHWIARRHGWALECPADNIALFRAPRAAPDGATAQA